MGLIREIRFDPWKGEFELGEEKKKFVLFGEEERLVDKVGVLMSIGRIGIFFGIVLRKGDFILRIFVFN